MMIKTITFKQQLINLLRTGFLFFIIFHTLIAQPLAIKGGRIITISGSVIEKGTILIDGGIIRDVTNQAASQIPSGKLFGGKVSGPIWSVFKPFT